MSPSTLTRCCGARVDGAGEYRIFGSIGLPMMLPGVVTIFMLYFVGTWNNFPLPYIMLLLFLRRFWRLDLLSGGLKG
ncbi:ABC transporter permease subunit [Nonomuraea fuscirosea]|uniref:ABC transporter permease subunit n=1 Tax=Nonomuraea fuscirosea TaxID=1291556 RepID=UPI0034492581